MSTRVVIRDPARSRPPQHNKTSHKKEMSRTILLQHHYSDDGSFLGEIYSVLLHLRLAFTQMFQKENANSGSEDLNGFKSNGISELNHCHSRNLHASSSSAPFRKQNERYLALINRAGGLYGRILTSVVCTDLTAFGLYSRPQSRFSHTD